MSGAAFIYYDPTTNEYFGRGRVGKITEDPADPKHSYAEIHGYQSFPHKVPFKDEHDQRRESGPTSIPRILCAGSK